VFVFDDEIAAFAQKNRNPELDKLDYYFFDPFGKMYYTLPFMGAFYLYGVASKKNKPKVVALDFVKASVYSGIVITGIKQLAHRHRPYQTNPPNPYLWDGPITKNLEYNSFASGHTIMAWTFAAVIATHYHDQQWIPITVYSLATLEAMARVYANKHWTSDVIVGAALGYAIGKWVVNNNKYCNLSFSPVVGSNYSGMNLNFRFGIPKQAMGSLSLER
jgi:membrane-associated phospholipid phosphatase